MEDPRIESGMQAQIARLRTERESGKKTLGWKVAFGAPASLERLRISAPLVGFLLERAQLPAGSRVSLSGWTKPVAEPEIALWMGRDLAGGASRDEAVAAISALAPAIELADADCPPEDVVALLAGNIYQRHVILGTADRTRAGCRLDGLVARVRRNGNDIACPTDPQALTGDYIDIVRHVADVLETFGERLCAGHIIITGSITPPLFVQPGDELVFDLAPVGAITTGFE